MKTQRIPETDSIEELARFWDTHDLADFEDQLEEVSEPVFERQTVMKVQLAPQEADAIEQIAKSKGVGSAALIKEWLLEKIRTHA